MEQGSRGQKGFGEWGVRGGERCKVSRSFPSVVRRRQRARNGSNSIGYSSPFLMRSQIVTTSKPSTVNTAAYTTTPLDNTVLIQTRLQASLSVFPVFREDLTIIGISVDGHTMLPSWKAAIRKYQLPWINLSDPEYSIPYYRYGSEQYPTKVLVDEERGVVFLNPKDIEIENLKRNKCSNYKFCLKYNFARYKL